MEMTEEQKVDLENRVKDFIEEVKGLSAKYKLNMRAVIKEDGPRFVFDNVETTEGEVVPETPEIVVEEPVKAE